MQRTFLRGPSTFLFLREVQEARRCHGSASEETTAPGSPKPWGGKRQSKPETHRTSVLFLSCPEAQKLRFQGADHSPPLRGPFRPKNPKEPNYAVPRPPAGPCAVLAGTTTGSARGGPLCHPPSGWRSRCCSPGNPERSAPPGAVRAPRCPVGAGLRERTLRVGRREPLLSWCASGTRK